MIEHMPEPSDLILYRTEDGQTRIEVRLADETVWMTQAAMAELYQGTKQNISLHLKNIFADRELREDRVVKEYLTTATDGKKYQTKFYNMEAKKENRIHGKGETKKIRQKSQKEKNVKQLSIRAAMTVFVRSVLALLNFSQKRSVANLTGVDRGIIICACPVK